jgi:SAM-dependent methyltransferase
MRARRSERGGHAQGAGPCQGDTAQRALSLPRRWQQLFWDVHSRTWDDAGAVRTTARCVAWARARLARGARVLDLGCGTGSHSLAIANDGHHVIGVDFSMGMLRRAHARVTSSGSLRVVQADLAHPLPIGDGLMDGLVSVSVLQCLPDPGELLSAACTALRAGGVALVGVKAVPGAHIRRSGWFEYVKSVASRAPQLHAFSTTALRTQLLRAGFSDVSVEEADEWIWGVGTRQCPSPE